MRRTIVMVIAAALATAAQGAGAQDTTGPVAGEGRILSSVTPALLSTHPRLRDALDRIMERSEAFRREVLRVAALGRRVIVVTSEQVPVQNPETAAGHAFDDSQLAAAFPIAGPDSGIGAVIVVLNLALLERLGRELLLDGRELDADIDRVLIHEVYAHAVPWLLEGRAGICPDPAPGQRAAEACSIRRENEVRAEAGLGLRTDYGLASLTLGRRPHF